GNPRRPIDRVPEPRLPPRPPGAARRRAGRCAARSSRRRSPRGFACERFYRPCAPQPGGARARLQYFGGADPMHNCVPRVFWAAALAAALALDAGAAKQTVKIAYIGPLTGGVSANGIGGRTSADLAVRRRDADAKAKYRYELVSPDGE